MCEIYGCYDIVVVGAGPTGICAAVSAARQGYRTVLVERYGVIGGNLTLGHVRTCLGSVSQGSMAYEVLDLLEVTAENPLHDTELAKILLTSWVKQSGCTVLLQTPVVEVYKINGQLKGVYISTPLGIRLIKGKIIIDATGDGTVASLSGAPFRMGRAIDQLMQPASVMFSLSNIKPGSLICRHEEDDSVVRGKSFLDMCRQAEESGELPKNVTVVRLYGKKESNERLVNATQQNYVNGLCLDDIFASQVSLFAQIEKVIKFLVNNVPGYENAKLSGISNIVGFRETRRIEGEYCLTSADIENGARFDDVVVHRALFCFDIHNPDGGGQAESMEQATKAQPYDIPYRCMIPKVVDGLIVAGRCISGTHRAHSSYRVMNICMAMGQAAGIAASIAVALHCPPRRVPAKEIQLALKAVGVDLFS